MISGITFMLLIVFQVTPSVWVPAPPLKFDTPADCEKARELVRMLSDAARTMCVENRSA